MKKYLSLVLMSLFLFSCDPASFQQAMDAMSDSPLSKQQIGQGLKEALNVGVKSGVNYLSATDGFYKSSYKILLPADARKVINKLKVIPGFSNLEQEVVKKINRSAEDAVVKAKPIFVNAIKSMSFTDAMNILMGDKNAATKYLNAKTYNNLSGAFKPDVVNSLNKFGALDYWADAVKTYNKIPFVKKMNPRLEDYIVGKTLDAVFNMVEKKELKIRTDITARTSDLLKKVFKKQDRR